MTKADQAAAERLLKAAVKRAAGQLRAGVRHPKQRQKGRRTTWITSAAVANAEHTLHIAGESAELLLGEASRG